MLDDRSRATLQNARILFVCEGSCERVVIETLLASGKLIIDESAAIRETITDRPTTNCRAAKTIQDVFLGLDYEQPVAIIRILDSRKEQFHLSYPYSETVPVFNCYTRPEIEMLAIIKENEFGRYNKRAKNKAKPSEFCKKTLGLGNIKNESFLRRYWSDADELCRCLLEYRRLHKPERDNELTIADLLK
ncbi:hypothetical protein [Bifidobacterium stellenboschense]|uniref:Uncharacterized protein n=1 Tax=Bifidobacterium stellenboschense TaxID=762211 RepID=A0A087DPX7_9BIFI|nr:hypothetical protein [Bifidobacterium stellenboschense]KFI97577.1 hypothetical protein BSTEL_0297 [Bifidobacterium stellenboschense]